jgi:anti-sigma regulatory factor (Ser/Thr protein kinase)
MTCTSVKSLLAVWALAERAVQGGVLDFSRTKVLDPAVMVILHHTASRRVGGDGLLFEPPVDPDARRWFSEHGVGRQYIGDTPMTNVYPSTYIAREDTMDPKLQAWQRRLNADEALREVDARMLSSTMSEVVSNSFQHGLRQGPKMCIVAGQTYRSENRARLCAADNGRTIPVSLRDRYTAASAGEFVGMALKRGVTCRSRTSNRGSGLFLLVKDVRRSGGSMLLLSGLGLVHVDSQRTEPVVHEVTDREPFRGTLLILDLPVGRQP